MGAVFRRSLGGFCGNLGLIGRVLALEMLKIGGQILRPDGLAQNAARIGDQAEHRAVGKEAGGCDGQDLYIRIPIGRKIRQRQRAVRCGGVENQGVIGLIGDGIHRVVEASRKMCREPPTLKKGAPDAAQFS